MSTLDLAQELDELLFHRYSRGIKLKDVYKAPMETGYVKQ